MADHSRDRVEAAAKAAWELEYPANTWPWDEVHIGSTRAKADHRERITATLAAADEADRVAGRVTIDTNDAAKIETAAKWLSSASRGWNWNHVSHESDREWWRQEARDFLAALGAAGAPEETHE